MKTRGLTEAQKLLIIPAIRERLDMPDDCDGCFYPLGSELRTRIVSYPVSGEGKPPKEARFNIQHRNCFESSVPVRTRGSERE